jgi:hypothetical protein
VTETNLSPVGGGRNGPAEPIQAANDRRQVYRWELECHGGRAPIIISWRRIAREGDHEIKAEAARLASAYLGHLWLRYARHFRPLRPTIPRLRLFWTDRPTRAARSLAHARAANHTIYAQADALSKAVLIHEACHLFTPGDGHGPEFCAALVRLWEREYRLNAAESIALAQRYGVHVARGAS